MDNLKMDTTTGDSLTASGVEPDPPRELQEEQEGHPHRPVEMADSEAKGRSSAPTPEDLIEQLKATVEQQRQALEEKDEEIKRLQRKYNKAKRMFDEDEWDDRRRERRERKEELRQMRLELEELLPAEEKTLLETMQVLKNTLVQVSSEGGLKLEEIRRLTRKADELKTGKMKNKTTDSARKGVALGLVGRKDAATIFPEEIWEMIIGHVSDPKDLWNLCNTCQLFDNILSKWKTGCWLLGQALPYLYKDLPETKLMECRLVCKSWKGAVDCFIENHPSRRPHYGHNIDPRRLDFVDPMKEKKLQLHKFIYFCDCDDTSILEDTSVSEMLRGNAFPGRYLYLDLLMYTPPQDDKDAGTEKLLEKARNLLVTFGDRVWYLKMYCHSDEVEVNQRILQFVTFEMFGYLPNLRELDMLGDYFSDRLITPESIPFCSKLETLQIENTRNIDPILDVRLRKHHKQLRKVCATLAYHPFRDLCSLDFPNLTELHLNLITPRRNIINQLCEVNMPQLTRLALKLDDISSNIGSFVKLLDIVRRLSSTTRLNTLRLDGGTYELHRPQPSGGYCAPPEIKTLEVDHATGIEGAVPDYSFLLEYFPFVENVHLFVKKFDVYEPDIDLRTREKCLQLALEDRHLEQFEIVEVNKYVHRGQMYRSNIWKLLRHLKVFTFQWDVYTRGGYEEYQEKRKNI